MRYREPVFRPPSEADSYILQVAYGCTHNKCAFCAMYRGKSFRLRPFAEIKEDIKTASFFYPDTRRVFLADGDALVLKTEKLSAILDLLDKNFPHLQRVGIYASTKGILQKKDSELQSLKEKKLSITYLGLESGSEEILKKMNKGTTASQMTEAVQKAQNNGIKMSVMIILGLGGKELSEKHALETAKILNEMNPLYLSALTLMLAPNTPLYDDYRLGKFRQMSEKEFLAELKLIIENLELKGTIFRSNHASNYLPLKGRFPKDKQALLDTLQLFIDNFDPSLLKPEFLRGF